MQVNSDENGVFGFLDVVIAATRQGFLRPVSVCFASLSPSLPYSATRFRLLLLLYVTKGTSMGGLKSVLGFVSVDVYMFVSSGLVRRYGPGRGYSACYRLTDRGEDFVVRCVSSLKANIEEESINIIRSKVNNQAKKKPRSFISRASPSRK